DSLDTHVAKFEHLLIGRVEAVTEQVEQRSKAAAEALTVRLEQLNNAGKTNAGGGERSLGQLTTNTTDAIRHSAQGAERTLTAVSSGVSNVLKQNASEVERTLLGVSAEVARNFVGKADEINNSVVARSAELTKLLDDKSSLLLTALGNKGQDFATEVSR